jgi:GNAT superfamily N-acetyltransferase
MTGALEVIGLEAAEVKPFIPDLARLRLEVFREYPYLYDGDEAYEATYLSTYTNSPKSFVVLVRDAEAVVGASTAIPLADVEAFQKPFREHGYDLRTIFYFGESVLLPAYRGRGLGKRFFIERERRARAGGFKCAAFCAVDRAADHPFRPASYIPLDAFWQRRGFVKQPALRATFSWKELHEPTESPKSMTFWLKQLE